MSEINKIVESIKTGKSSARVEVEAAIKRAEADDANAILEIIRDRALNRADEIDAKIAAGEDVGRLAGVPFVAKDNFLTLDSKTTAASKILENFEAPLQATAVEKLEAEGAICIGKANLDAFAHGGSTENSAYGVTKNAVDDKRVAGGSSGGSAVAVAEGIVSFALGSDTGGSIRQPASFNGVVGYKPTYGMISRYGVVAMASSTDVIGPIAKTVEDVEILCEIMAGQDKKDGTVYPGYFTSPETTFILCGGNDRSHDGFGRKLAGIVTEKVKNPRILDVFFMRPDKEWKDNFQVWTDFYDKYFKNYTHEMATIEKFYEQAKTADVIFFHGGRTKLLTQNLPDTEKVKKVLEGKIYIGSSAGANYVAEHYSGHKGLSDKEGMGITDGAGILQVNVVVHYGSNDPVEARSEGDANELERAFPQTETIRIREGDFDIIRVPLGSKSMKIGLIKQFMDDGVDASVRKAIDNQVNQLRKAGHTVEEVDLNMVKYAVPIYYIVVPAEVSSNLARYDGVRYGARADTAKTLAQVYGQSRDTGFMDENKRRIMIGSYVLSSGFFDAYYLQAQKARTLLIEEFNKLFEQYDFLIGPVAPTPAFKIGENINDLIKMYLGDIMTIPASLAGLPAISVPAGTDEKGLPIGLQIIGPMKSDAKLLEFSKGVEA